MSIIGLLGASAALFVFRGSSGGGAANDPMAAVPAESFVIANVSVAELRKSPIWTAVFGKDGAPASRVLGIGVLGDACGFDPLTRVDRLAVAVPEEGNGRDFGIAARVQLTPKEVETCAKTLAEKRGVDAKPTEVGPFSVLKSGTAKLAYSSSGLLVVGKSGWFDWMLETAQGIHPNAQKSAAHEQLRHAITDKEGWRAPTAVITAVLPKSIRDRLRRDMDDDSDDPNSKKVMSGVLAVSGLAVGIKAGGPGGSLEVAVEMTCDSADACAIVDTTIQRKRLEWSQDFRIRLAGFGQAIDSLVVKHDGTTLRATASASADGIAQGLERVMKLGGAGGGSGGPGPVIKRLPAAAPKPDEVIKPDGG